MSDNVERQVSDDDLVNFSTIEAVVSSRTDLDIVKEIQNWDGEHRERSSSIVSFIEQRQFLLLDESIFIAVILRVLRCSEATLRSFLNRTQVSVEVRAIGHPIVRPVDPNQPAQVNEILQTLGAHELGSFVIVQSPVEEDDYMYVVWQAQTRLVRPKAKLQKLGVYLAATATSKASTNSSHGSAEDDYLPSLGSLPSNVLQTLSGDPTFANAALYVKKSETGSAYAQDPHQIVSRGIKAGPRQLFRTAPALLWRLRFLTMPDSPRTKETLVAVDFEITGFAEAPVRIETVDLIAVDGEVDALCSTLPLTANPGDQGTLIFRLTHNNYPSAKLVKEGVPHEIKIDAKAVVLISDTCQPRISITWNTIVEAPNTRPASGSQPVLHAARPISGEARASGDLSKAFDPDALTMADNQVAVQPSATVASGITLTFVGPKKITVGKAFEWQIFVANKSTKSQRLAIVTLPRSRLSHRPGSKAQGLGTNSRAARMGGESADGNRHTHADDHTSLVCLTPDIRIGPLPPSACHEVDIKFLPLERGVLHLEAIRLVDLSNQNAIDIANIPDIVVEE